MISIRFLESSLERKFSFRSMWERLDIKYFWTSNSYHHSYDLISGKKEIREGCSSGCR